MNTSRSRSSPTSSSSAAIEVGLGLVAARVEFVAQLDVFPLDAFVTAEVVERAVLGDRHQPRAGIARHAFGRPLFERGDQRVMREILGQADVADDADETGDQARRFDAPDRVDGALDVGGRRSSQHSIRPSSSPGAQAVRVLSAAGIRSSERRKQKRSPP